jgi:hypothetical protein
MNAIDDHLLKSFRLTGEIVPSVGRGLLVASDSTFWQSVVQSPPAAGASILGAGATIRQLPPSTSCTPSLSLLPRLLNDPDTAGHENCCKRSSSSAAAAAATGGARFRILMAAELRLARRPASHPTLGCRCLLLLLQLSFPPRSLLRHPQSRSLQPGLFASVRIYHSALRPLQAASLSSAWLLEGFATRHVDISIWLQLAMHTLGTSQAPHACRQEDPTSSRHLVLSLRLVSSRLGIGSSPWELF